MSASCFGAASGHDWREVSETMTGRVFLCWNCSASRIEPWYRSDPVTVELLDGKGTKMTLVPPAADGR